MPFDPSNDYDETFKPPKSDGTLPLDYFAGGVRYKKELFISIPSGIGSSYVLDGTFKNRIRESAAANSTILLEQEVEWRALILAIGGFATWAPQDDKTKITTTIINGAEIDPATAWQYVDVPEPDEFSETLGYTVFDPIGVVSIFGYDFTATWYSPPYRVNIPPGAVLERVFDHWGIGTLKDEATFGFSFRHGVQTISTWLDDFRANRVATPLANSTQIAFSYPLAGFNKPILRSLLTLQDCAIVKDRHNRLFVAGIDGNDYRLYVSYDDGSTFAPMRYPFTITDIDMPIWKNGETNHDLTVDTSGGFASVAQLGVNIYIRTSNDGVLWSSPRLVAARKKNEPYTIRCASQTGELIVSNGDLSHVLRSRDGGRSWEDVSPQ